MPARSARPSSGAPVNMAGLLPGTLTANSTAAGASTAAVLVALGDAVAVQLADASGALDSVTVCVAGGVSVGVPDGGAERVRERGAVRVRLVEGVPVWLGDGVAVPDGDVLDDRVRVGVRVTECVTEGDGVGVRVIVPGGLVDGALDGDAPTDRDDVGVGVALGGRDVEGLPVSLGDRVGAGVSETLLVPVADRVATGLVDGAALPLGLRGAVRDGEVLWRALMLGLTVAAAVPLRDGVLLGEALPAGLRSDATLSPRYVSRARTASGVSPPLPPPPAPPAASHSSTDSRTPLAMVLDGTSCVTFTYR